MTCPTLSTLKRLDELKIFPKKKLKLLYDPILKINYINIKKNEKIDYKFIKTDYILSIGRLTKQKNFSFLIKMFSKHYKNFKTNKLLIIGDGEEKNKLLNIIKKNKMENNIFLLEFKKNVYNYINSCEGIISAAEYEDPGFVLIEGAYLKKKKLYLLWLKMDH